MAQLSAPRSLLSGLMTRRTHTSGIMGNAAFYPLLLKLFISFIYQEWVTFRVDFKCPVIMERQNYSCASISLVNLLLYILQLLIFQLERFISTFCSMSVGICVAKKKTHLFSCWLDRVAVHASNILEHSKAVQIDQTCRILQSLL